MAQSLSLGAVLLSRLDGNLIRSSQQGVRAKSYHHILMSH